MTAFTYAAMIVLGYAYGRYRPWLRLRNTARWVITMQPKQWARTRTLLALVLLADELVVAYWHCRRRPPEQRRPAPALVVRKNRGDQ